MARGRGMTIRGVKRDFWIRFRSVFIFSFLRVFYDDDDDKLFRRKPKKKENGQGFSFQKALLDAEGRDVPAPLWWPFRFLGS